LKRRLRKDGSDFAARHALISRFDVQEQKEAGASYRPNNRNNAGDNEQTPAQSGGMPCLKTN
jgi:hypothetical protein